MPIMRLSSYFKETMSKMYMLSSAESITFYCNDVLLKPNESLEEAVEKYWKSLLPLELKYKITAEATVCIKNPLRVPPHLSVGCFYCNKSRSMCNGIKECSVCLMATCEDCLVGEHNCEAKLCKACNTKYILPC